jgi:hypothetical protein
VSRVISDLSSSAKADVAQEAKFPQATIAISPQAKAKFKSRSRAPLPAPFASAAKEPARPAILDFNSRWVTMTATLDGVQKTKSVI